MEHGMKLSRRRMLASMSAMSALATLPGAAAAQASRTVRLGVGLKFLNTTFTNVMIGERLGYNRAAGFALEGLALGALSNVLVALDKREIEFGIVSPSVALPLFAKGQLPPITCFYEYTYPYKWDVAVKPDSPLKSYEDLSGKKIGVSNLGTTDYPVTKAVLASLGIDPVADVAWVAVGEGVIAGAALERGVIDALAYFDTGFGQIESAGIALRYLPRPSSVPMIGGFFLAARRDFLASDRALCTDFARSVAMATEFVLANPAAGARAFLDMYPGTAPRGASPAEAVERTVHSIARRLGLYRPPYEGARLGEIREAEWRAEARFLDLAIADLAPLFTNELIAEVNDFDRDAVIAAAKAYRV
jgi:NitT/TauT family transport system substrate-binding protein